MWHTISPTNPSTICSRWTASRSILLLISFRMPSMDSPGRHMDNRFLSVFCITGLLSIQNKMNWFRRCAYVMHLIALDKLYAQHSWLLRQHQHSSDNKLHSMLQICYIYYSNDTTILGITWYRYRAVFFAVLAADTSSSLTAANCAAQAYAVSVVHGPQSFGRRNSAVETD